MWATWIWTAVLRSGPDILIGSNQHIIGTPTLRSEWEGVSGRGDNVVREVTHDKSGVSSYVCNSS